MRSEEFDGVYGIMESSFPADEIRPHDEQKERLSRENYVIYVTPSKNGRVGAFITVYDFPGFAFVEHFAVAEDFLLLYNCDFEKNKKYTIVLDINE